MSELYRDSIFWVETERIAPNPYQPRTEFNEEKLAELADSIRMYGLLQPLTVTRHEEANEDGNIRVTYELIAGERRLRASKIAGLQQVPVIIRSGEEDDQLKLELAIIENLQREDLNPIDRALAFNKLIKEFGFSHIDVGKRVGRSREYVSNTVRILALPEHMQAHLMRGEITEGHTRPLLMLATRPAEQETLLQDVLLRKLTVRETEALARRAAQDRVTDRHKLDPALIELEKQLTERLGTRVRIEPKQVGGKLVINYFSANDLQTLLSTMKVEEEAVSNTAIFDGDPRQAPKVEENKPAEAEQSADTREETKEEPETEVEEEQANDSPLAVDTPASAEEQGVVPGTYPLPEEEEPETKKESASEEDDDLYSIRNFTI